MQRKTLILVLLLLLGMFAVLPAGAQDMPSPSVEVSDQVSLDGWVTITSAYSEGPGFVVIHIDNNGAPGPVAGQRWVNPGWNFNIAIPIDTAIATPTLFAMLHVDTGEVGVYEFGTVEGADGPVVVDGNVVTPSFKVDAVHAKDQFVSEGTVNIAAVIAQVDGWIVIHSDNEGRPGPVLGQAQVAAGTNVDVAVTLEADATSVLWPMLHVDTGTVGTYEFGTVEGADGPVAVNGKVAVTPIWTVPHMRVANQIVTHGDGMEMMEGMAPTVTAASVLAEVDGFLVIHQENEGGPGPVAGVAPVSAGLNENVVVELDPAMVTPNLWPMLHVDTGAAGEYEFGTVEGADGPVVVNDQVVTFQINAAPSIKLEGTLAGNVLTVSGALIDAPGWLAIHNDNNGAPGPVIGVAPLLVGNNSNITVTLDEAGMTDNYFPMLHYDTGAAGQYEFGAVEGADGPTFVGGNVVVGPLTPMAGE